MAIYEIAGLRIKLNNRFRYTEKLCEKYLSKDQVTDFDLFVTVTDEEIVAEKKLNEGFSDGYVESVCLYRNFCVQLPAFNRFLLHSAVIEFDGKGYAFLGKSGAGKSTHSSLWLKYLPKAKIVNGDKPILSIEKGGVRVFGTPWMGKEGRGENTSVLLNGLCFIEQAKENEIKQLSTAETARRIMTQVLFPADEKNMTATLELLDVLVQSVPAYLLKCDISREAFLTSFEKMTNTTYREMENED